MINLYNRTTGDNKNDISSKNKMKITEKFPFKNKIITNKIHIKKATKSNKYSNRRWKTQK